MELERSAYMQKCPLLFSIGDWMRAFEPVGSDDFQKTVFLIHKDFP
jgi:hypothetical protein